MNPSKTALIIMSALTTGCTSYQWINHADPKADFQNDLVFCQNESVRSVPKPQPTYVNQPTQTTCRNLGGIVKCNTSGGGIARVEDPWAEYENNNRRDAYVERCLVTKGWRQQEIVSKSNSPAGKVSAPDKSISMTESGRELFNYVAIRKKEFCASAEYEEVVKKAPCDPRDIGDHIFNKTYPSKQEISKIKALNELIQNLYVQELQAYKTDLGAGSERWRTIMTIYNGKELRLNDQFYTGKMTWGTFNMERSRIYLDRRKAF